MLLRAGEYVQVIRIWPERTPITVYVLCRMVLVNYGQNNPRVIGTSMIVSPHPSQRPFSATATWLGPIRLSAISKGNPTHGAQSD